MTHAQRIFGKGIEHVTYADVENYFTENRTETNYIEYKSYPKDGSLEANCEIIRKAICALLNSDEALFKQIKFTNIEGYLRFSALEANTSNTMLLIVEVFLFNFSELQNETDVSFTLTTIPGRITRIYDAAEYLMEDSQIRFRH